MPAPTCCCRARTRSTTAKRRSPPEELNVLRDGVHYGWPYCIGAQAPARGYEGRFDCKQTEAPAGSGRPMRAAADARGAAGAANAFAGQLLVAWHGYRAGGHRIVGQRSTRRAGRRARPGLGRRLDGAEGVRPLGAPTGIAVDSAGRLLIVEDRHKTLLMLSRETP